MHTLLVLSAVLTSLSASEEASIHARFELRSPLTLPGSQRGEFHLLDTTKIHDKDEDEGSTLRGLVEFLGGVTGGGVGGGSGLLLLALNPRPELAAVASGLMLLGVSTGVSIAGWAMDGRGSYGFALLGSIIGFTVPLLAGLAISQASGCLRSSNCDGVLLPMGVGIALLTPLGATIGYELSAPTPWLSLEASRAPAPAPRIAPMVTLARQGLGVTFGIAGSL